MDWLQFITMHYIAMPVFIFIFGAIIGSFLNVVIYRYPIMLQREWRLECLEQLNQPAPEKEEPLNLCFPGSHCPHCKTKIPFWLNIPILSYLFLQGKCRSCRASISRQYFLVEIISAFLTVIVFLHFSIPLQTAEILLFTYGLIALSFIDFNYQFLPDPITYVLLWLGLIVSTQHYFTSPTDAIYAAIIGYLFLWSVAKLYFLFRKKEGMGLGDCKMLAMMGAWVGIMGLLNILLFSTLVALSISIILLLFRKMEHTNPIPFGPFIAVAGWCTVVYGNQLLQGIMRWMQ